MELDIARILLYQVVKNNFYSFIMIRNKLLCSCLLAATNHLSIIYLAYSPDFIIVTEDTPQHFDNKCADAPDSQDNQRSYMFDTSVFKTTVVTEWNLV